MIAEQPGELCPVARQFSSTASWRAEISFQGIGMVNSKVLLTSPERSRQPPDFLRIQLPLAVVQSI
jgi:hypothetical protein